MPHRVRARAADRGDEDAWDGGSGSDKASPAYEALTPREVEVLDWMAAGATNAEIARRLTVSQITTKSHVQHILRKLGAKNRTTAVAAYLRR